MDDAATAEVPARGGRRAPGLVHREWPAHGGQAKADLTLSRKSGGGFSAGDAGLGLLHRGEHAFTEVQVFPFPYTPVEGISKLAHLNGELA